MKRTRAELSEADKLEIERDIARHMNHETKLLDRKIDLGGVLLLGIALIDLFMKLFYHKQ